MPLTMTTVVEHNNFTRKDKDSIISNPKQWWLLNNILPRSTEVVFTHENISENSSDIEQWIDDNIDTNVICYSHIEKRENDIDEKTVLWSFHFKKEEDAVWFATVWKGTK